MARINIDDSIFSDPRFLFVCDEIGRFKAMGEFVFLVRAAQKYWVDGSGIPKESYSLFRFSEVFLTSGLVKEKDSFFYLSGAEEHFSWLAAKKENGKKGGRPKKENLSNINKSECLEQKDENLKKPTGFSEKAKESYENPLALALALSPALALDNKKETVFDFEKIYQAYPRKEGKSKGLAKLKSTIKTQKKFDDFRKATWNYIKSCDGKDKTYIKHFDTFVGCWTDYVDLAPEASTKQATTSLKSRLLDVLPGYHRHIAADDLAKIKSKFSEGELEAISSAGGFIAFSQANEFELAAKLKNLGEIFGGAA